MANKVKKCKQCGKILIKESKFGLCPKCADQDKRTAAGIFIATPLVAGIIKKTWKPVKKAATTAVKIIFRV